MPTYPFAREKYWLESLVHGSLKNGTIKEQLHPLLHRNTSNLSGLRFSSTFTGEEFFWVDRLGGRVLPAIAHLEMVRVAAEQVSQEGETGDWQEDARAGWRQGIRLENIVWATPILGEDFPTQVHISPLAPRWGASCVLKSTAKQKQQIQNRSFTVRVRQSGFQLGRVQQFL